MASSPDIKLKERLDASFKDTAALSALWRNIAFDIESGSMKFLTVVETLGSYITDQDNVTRGKGITVLSSVLSQLSQDYLTELELQYIVAFYCDRMKDHHSIIPPVLNGVLAIANMTRLPQSAPSSLLRAIFENVQCQSQLFAERQTVYLIFKSFVENKLDYLKSMGPDLVYGIISSIDGERDPKNLMLLFGILSQFIKEFPLGHLTEETFEVLACYFPVDFNPTDTENLSVTREDLAESLAPCLCATPEFANYCIPLIIDKLYSTLRVAKLDSLHLLRDGVPTFGSSRMKQYLPELWIILQKEILSGRDAEVKDAALEAIASLVKVLSDDEATCKDFINKIIADIKSSLHDVQLSLYRPAQKLLETMATVSKAICVQILQAVVPLCIGQYSTKISSNDKIVLIDTLNSFMGICSNHEFSIQELAWANIPQTYLDDLTVENIELKSKVCLGLTLQKAHLNDVQRSVVYNAICNEIEAGRDEIQAVCHATIIDFAALHPQEISLLVEERLLSNMDEANIELLKRKIKALLAIAKLQKLGCAILRKIVAMLTNDTNVEICITILLNIQKLITSRTFDFNAHQFLYQECHVIDKLTSYKTDVAGHKMLISNVCQLIARNLTIEEQRAIVAKYAAALSTRIRDTDVRVDAIMNLLIPLRRDINLNINRDMVGNLYDLAISSSSVDMNEATCKFLSVLLNKMEAADLDEIVPYLEDKLSSNLKTDIAIELKQHAVSFYIWMTKALITRGYWKSQYFLESITQLLTHDEVGRFVGEQYQILVSKHEDILTAENFCTVKMFYKQRVFEYLLQQNVNFTSSMRQNYLIALVHSLKQMPEELLFLHLAKLVPLLIESLTLSDEHLVLWSLTSLKLLLDTKHDIFSDNIQCVIPRLLQLSTHRMMDARVAALECLARYTNYSIILINPYKQVVLDKLGIIIDDRKRLVRKAAVDARTRWFIAGASGDGKE
ncbi:MMS19 nucleotide excision repair protein homolog isoform X2 [Ooceraea biroi]|uniref:MMS19 nucleotide excision repair protein homolog isoform X2 n=1 Tax=Ooceraea biroi TaxID=2015173 RepID=UPI000F07CEED|nr:MMS19 nucleotide excision repair protein homolog isoform X2 [Ooceraea biroi]